MPRRPIQWTYRGACFDRPSLLKRVTLAVLILAFASLSLAGNTFPGYDYVEFSLALNNSTPFGIVAGPDGRMWFTDFQQGAIGRMTVDGSTKFFPLNNSSTEPQFITVGSDGNLWFTDPGLQSIGRITPLGDPTSFPLPLSGLDDPGDIVAGPDKNLWFTDQAIPRGVEGGRIGRITLNGTVSLLPVDAPAIFLTNGPDGALWFTSYFSVGRITTTGQSRLFDVGGAAGGITTGPDGALWFTNACFVALDGVASSVGSNCDFGLGRLTTDGVLTKFPDVEAISRPSRITRGPEDNLWFARDDGRISRINLAGRVDDIVFHPEGPASEIAVGPDGALWLAFPSTHSIGRVDSLAYRFVNIANGAPLGLAEAPNGDVLFADAGGNRVGRLGSDGSLIQHELGGGHTPNAIAAGPDGSAWFTNSEANTIGHLTPEDDFIEFTISPPNATPQDIVLGPDDNLWFTLGTGSVGRITTQGVITTFPAPSASAKPQGIAVGADHNLWFTESAANRIGRMTTSGAAIDFPVPTAASEPWDIAAGADGALYFTELRGGRVGRITTEGLITELGVASVSTSPRYITLGPDGAMWFTVIASNNTRPAGVADEQPREPVAVDPTPTPTAGQPGLGRIARDGRITTFRLPMSEENPAGIAGGRDGQLFVALFDLSQIADIDLVAAEPTQTVTPTTEDTPVATSTPTIENTPVASTTPTTENTPAATTTATGSTGCPGDCDGNKSVLIGELISAVNIALGNAPVTTCRAADIDGDGKVLINELIAAVNRALQGC